MVSSTQQSSRIRRRKSTTNGKWNKRDRRRLGTPAFAVHPEGYDPTAADARPAASAAGASDKGAKLDMANHPSAEKRNRQRVKRTDRNRTVKSALRTTIKKARSAIEAGGAAVEEALKVAVTSIDKAASKGVVHPKAASRKKSRLARAAHKAKTAPAAAPAASKKLEAFAARSSPSRSPTRDATLPRAKRRAFVVCSRAGLGEKRGPPK